MKTLKLAVIALTAAFSVSAFAQDYPSQNAINAYNEEVKACEAKIDYSKPFDIFKAEEFICAGNASLNRDRAIHGSTMHEVMNSPIDEKTIDALFNKNSMRSALVVDDKVTIKNANFPDGLDIVELATEAKAKGFATKSWSVVSPGHETLFTAMAVSKNDQVLVVALTDDGALLSAKKYLKKAEDEAKKAAAKEAKEAAK